MVNINGLNNLIWVWNGQHKEGDSIEEWYPGDTTVDIIGEDIYAEKQDYSSQVDRFANAMKYTKANKIITLSETGVIPDPDELLKAGNLWSWFSPWYREFVVDMDYKYENANYSDEYTGLNMLRKIYHHENVITLDELPLLNEKAIKPKMLEEEAVHNKKMSIDGSIVAWGTCAVLLVGFVIVISKLIRLKKRDN